FLAHRLAHLGAGVADLFVVLLEPALPVTHASAHVEHALDLDAVPGGEREDELCQVRVLFGADHAGLGRQVEALVVGLVEAAKPIHEIAYSETRTSGARAWPVRAHGEGRGAERAVLLAPSRARFDKRAAGAETAPGADPERADLPPSCKPPASPGTVTARGRGRRPSGGRRRGAFGPVLGSWFLGPSLGQARRIGHKADPRGPLLSGGGCQGTGCLADF